MKRCGVACEVYSRVTGYFRPVKNWNAGKQEEFRDRLAYATDSVVRGEVENLRREAPSALETCACV